MNPGSSCVIAVRTAKGIYSADTLALFKMVEYGAKSESGEKLRWKIGRRREEETPYPHPFAVFLLTSLCAVHKI